MLEGENSTPVCDEVYLHSAHLCASHACEKLPRAIENVVRDVYSYFSHSAKRLAGFQKFQLFAQVEPHKILKPAQVIIANVCFTYP